MPQPREIGSPGVRRSAVAPGDSRLAERLRRAVEGEVLFDAYSRGRYGTDASIYQIEPVGVVVPKSRDDVAAAFSIAREEGVPLLPRGGGTSQCGQTVGEALVIDTSKHMDRVLDLDSEARTVRVEPGLVLDRLNTRLRRHNLFFPVDVSTSSRATIGGMAGNNSCGSRSIRYGNMVHNVRAVDALLADGARLRFGPLAGNMADLAAAPAYARLVDEMCTLAEREADEIQRRFPRVQRRVGGYNIDMIPLRNPAGGFRRSEGTKGIGTGHDWAERVGGNMAHLLVGSEGTLAFFEAIELALQPIPPARTLGICHFPKFRDAMASAQHLVALDPTAVELVDRTLIGLAREIPLYRQVVERIVRGAPEALLLVEFTGEDEDEQRRKLGQLVELMAELGFPGAVVELTDPAAQKEVWELRKACLNIAMSMKGDGKPVSFVEDCAVRLEDLADYTERLTGIFHKHGTEGTWYAHASVGTLHVRPILNLKQDTDVASLRAIAEEAFELVREYKGAHSGEHGDGIVRSEFHEPMFGPRIISAFEEVKDSFDPEGLMNPGKIVRPYRMDDRSLFRYPPGYAPLPIDTALDWSDWGGFAGAVEMCNNNGACRKSDPGVMCPSYRATRDEKHVTRGRANTLRLAITGQLGPDAFTSDQMYETMDLCVGCKGCKRECPTGVDMAKMKIEFLHHYTKRHGLRARDRLIAYLPRYAPLAAKLPWLLNLRDRVPGLARLSEALFGLSARRSLPPWRRGAFRDTEVAADLQPTSAVAPGEAAEPREVVLFADTFNRYFEPENLRAALRVLSACGYRVATASVPGEARPLCCGRTFLSQGLVEEARREIRRTLDALLPYLRRGVPLIGLEPSCLFTFRDEVRSLLPGPEAELVAGQALLFEEFLARESDAGRLPDCFAGVGAAKVLLHGHCHQKAFAAMDSSVKALHLIPGLEIDVVDSSCCGMAGTFGYEAGHYEVSMDMAELSLLPKVRSVDETVIVAADGTSCRHQIRDGTGRDAVHVARVLDMALQGRG